MYLRKMQIMVVSFLQILQESVKKLMPGGPRDTATLPPTAIFAMLSTVIVKGIIWIFCVNIKTTQVQALAQGKSSPPYSMSCHINLFSRLQD